ncbi:NACHT, LRR and PYD domains-containing protein 1b allele 2-like isoform X2 [Thunnus albacares]|uniref:NACHT, LRR and PYD domains-containing protein 1b allele 2-like isoform X2 n=1 Tax=Thunnus albacares TaxID=8236 RepID=UPI001CF67726|nr:NACHT, LRR and PYD domains-containing protein 1b allele 2-like isoform X2 [Thunnus albacares]
MQDLLHLEKKPGGFHILTAGATSCFYNEMQRSSLLQKDVTVTPVEEKLLETLEELSLTEKFKGLLQDPPLRGSQRLGKSRKTDLVQSLSDTSSGSKGLSGSSEFEARGNITDSSDWTTVEPEVIRTDADEAPTYSLQSEAGKFECSVSDLRWVCEEKVSFKYQFCSWEEHVERMKSLQYMPAGPLLNIKVTAGKLNEVHLPHWICTDDSTILDKFAVLHIDGCGDVVEDVSEVTSSHVKLSEPSFSLRGVLMKLGFPVNITCSVLIYNKPNTTPLKLHVYLIPHDPALQEMVDEKESSDGYKVINKPHPDRYLRVGQKFLLTADIDRAKIVTEMVDEEEMIGKKYLKVHHGFVLTADKDTVEINPKELTLGYDSKGPNFFEVFIENPGRDFYLELFHSKERGKSVCEPVWYCKIQKDDYPNSGHSEDVGSSSGATGGATSAEGRSTGKNFVDKHRSALIENVYDIDSILDDLKRKGVIQQGVYNKIRAMLTTEEKMRELYNGPLRAGDEAKEIFYTILEKREPFLVADLKKKES